VGGKKRNKEKGGETNSQLFDKSEKNDLEEIYDRINTGRRKKGKGPIKVEDKSLSHERNARQQGEEGARNE